METVKRKKATTAARIPTSLEEKLFLEYGGVRGDDEIVGEPALAYPDFSVKLVNHTAWDNGPNILRNNSSSDFI